MTQNKKTQLNPLDKNNFKKVILETQNQFQTGFELVEKYVAQIKKATQGLKGREIDCLVVAGMGGSAMPGYLMQTFLKTNFPILIHSNYGLPRQLGANPLFIISSFSGNTEETLDVLKTAGTKNYPVICFSNGGQLEKTAQKADLPYFNYKITTPGFQPRSAPPLTFTVMALVLARLGLIKDPWSTLKKTADFLARENNKILEKQGRELAQAIQGKSPIFYASYELRFAALINKIKINENSKFTAFWNYYPELDHNEFNGFKNANPKQFCIISLESPASREQNQKRIQVTNKIINDLGFKIHSVPVKGETLMEQFFYCLLSGDWLSYYLALDLGQDPTPVDMVEMLKKELKK
jgi:glucose/mannose-6-phosphate isomerase